MNLKNLIISIVLVYCVPTFSQEKSWLYLGTNEKIKPCRYKEETYDVAVLGGGISGICAAVASARHGAKTVLIQDRPVLGGNASSEMRVILNGAYCLNNKFKIDRETGIVEELQLENCFYNPQDSWSMWDNVLYNYVLKQPNLTLKLNTSVISAEMDNGFIAAAKCRHLLSETDLKINADLFIDCTGDGVLAADAGAEYRTGRESKSEFGESYAPEKSDGWVMGDGLLLYAKNMGTPVNFKAPDYAIKYDPSKYKIQRRKINDLYVGYWWVELGSDFDVIADREKNATKLKAYLYGVWDYIKNSGNYPEAENLALDWMGSLPAPRESRRFIGDYILTQNDILSLKNFDDAVAYGGWSLDEHCPGGIENYDDPPSYFHKYCEDIYQIPYRSLYSKNIPNLFFAGRNVSVTHIALSSTRVMATCGLMGQAVGTAAGMCIKNDVLPRDIYNKYINELQETLLKDDVFIPNRPARDRNDLARCAHIYASSTGGGDVNNLIDGYSRDELDKIHYWESDDTNAVVDMIWDKEVRISNIMIKCNSNLHKKICMIPDPSKQPYLRKFPEEILKKMEVEAFVGGKWKKIALIDNNIYRLISIDFKEIKTSHIRLNLLENYGADNIRLYEIRCYEKGN